MSTQFRVSDGLLLDTRVDCYSLMLTQSISDYLNVVNTAYKNKGNIAGQREALKTTTAKRIRSRMVDDIISGAILPPLVVGIIVNEHDFSQVPELTIQKLKEFIVNRPNDTTSIIDEMQRTTAINEALQRESRICDKSVRVEYWIAKSTDSLIYRMLVLNTGQVPWNLQRQLSVVYDPLVQEIKKHVSVERIMTVDEPGRRTRPAEYAAHSVVEMFIAFGLRKTIFEIDTQETLADEFSRLDIVEAISNRIYTSYFYNSLQLMVDIDKEFSRYKSDDEGRFSSGRNIFDSQPARIGFMVAVAMTILGRVGMERHENERDSTFSTLKNNISLFVSQLHSMDAFELGNFLKLDVLSDVINKKVSNVGRFERNLFYEAFKVLIEERFNVPSMEPCWRA